MGKDWYLEILICISLVKYSHIFDRMYSFLLLTPLPIFHMDCLSLSDLFEPFIFQLPISSDFSVTIIFIVVVF